MTRDERVLQIVGEIYDAAGSPEQWATCLASIRELFHGTAAHLLFHDHRSHVGGISATTMQDPAAIQPYTEHFHRLDPWALKIPSGAFSGGEVVVGESLVSHHDMVKTEFYNDYGRPNGFTRTVVGLLDASASRVTAALTINRSDRRPEFDSADARLVQILVPHLQRALALHHRLANIDAQRGAAADVIDRLAVGVVLLDGNLRPVLVNQAASRLFAQRDGLTLEARGLRAGTAALTLRLRQMIVSATAVTEGTNIDVGGGALTIPRPSGRRPLQVVVTPVARENEYAGGEARAAVAVFITDPDRKGVQSDAVLRRLYRLTPAEARVAIAIAEGQKVDQIAASFRLTVGTVRWYVKQALAKTGVSTQAQLVRVVLSAPDAVR